MKWGSWEEKVTQSSLFVLWNFKGPEIVCRKYWSKIRRQQTANRAGKCQRSKALKPSVQKAPPSNPCEQCPSRPSSVFTRHCCAQEEGQWGLLLRNPMWRKSFYWCQRLQAAKLKLASWSPNPGWDSNPAHRARTCAQAKVGRQKWTSQRKDIKTRSPRQIPAFPSVPWGW